MHVGTHSAQQPTAETELAAKHATTHLDACVVPSTQLLDQRSALAGRHRRLKHLHCRLRRREGRTGWQLVGVAAQAVGVNIAL